MRRWIVIDAGPGVVAGWTIGTGIAPIEYPVMRIGIGLPTTTPGTTGSLLIEWARRADRGPFASLGTLDRVVYQSFDPFVALAAAAAVTRRVELVTMIVIAPIRDAAMLAKQAATVHSFSGGRLTLGLATGARLDD